MPLASLLRTDGVAAPFRYPVFRRIWLGSLLSNLGQMIQGVGAAWAMMQLTAAADMVALVQTASMLPIMLLALASGAIADMYDRRIVSMCGLSISLLGAGGLSILTWAGLLSPGILLMLCFTIGSGVAIFGPAWQSSVSEQVEPDTLPSAIALNGISFNIARSFGPAVGGLIVAAAGAIGAFVINALLYVPLLLVLSRWQRVKEAPRLPPERIGRAIISGVRYILHSPAIRVVLIRTLLVSGAGASILALMPLVARDLLGGSAETYGVMLGAFGVGAILGALSVSQLRSRFSGEAVVSGCAALMGLSVLVVSHSGHSFLTGLALICAGFAWMLAMAVFNIAIQLSAPRWVAGRALAAFQAAATGGIAIGAWGWGHAAQSHGTAVALIMSACVLLVLPAIGLWLRIPSTSPSNDDARELLKDPEVRLALTARSGPVIIEVEYRVAMERARDFYDVMQTIQSIRQRTGAYGWSIARDVEDPELWTERFHTPTWHDYLHHRNRPTQAEREAIQAAMAFQSGDQPVRIRRMLERPFGSVRWREDAPDRGQVEILPAPSSAAT